MKKFLGLVLSVAVVVGMGVSSAAALCNPAQSATTQEFTVGVSYYAYLNFTDTDEANFVGNFWQTGQKGVTNGDAMPLTQWLKGGYPGYVLFDINLGDGAVAGCPPATDTTAKMSVFLDNCISDEAVLLTVQRTNVTPLATDFSFTNRYFPSAYISPGTSPRPHVNSSSRAGDVVSVNATVPDLTPIVTDATGGPGAISETRIYSRRFTNNLKPPTSTTTGWTLRNTFAGEDGGTANVLSLDCAGLDANRDDLWLATGIVVSGDVILGCPIAIECGGNLADPTGRPNRKLDRTATPKTDSPQ
jgi:hypothetical protein